MCHVSDDLVGTKLCPQGTIPFFSLMPSSTETIGPRDTKFGTGVQGQQGLSEIVKLRGVQKLGGSKFRKFSFFAKKTT